MAYIADNEHNIDLEVVLDDMAAPRAEGHRLLVHGHGGASRTGLVLRAWLMRTEGLSAATDPVGRGVVARSARAPAA